MERETPELLAAMRGVLSAIVAAVKAAGSRGAPGGVIYAGLAVNGCTLDQYTSIMNAMVAGGILVRRGELYFLPEGQAPT